MLLACTTWALRLQLGNVYNGITLRSGQFASNRSICTPLWRTVNGDFPEHDKHHRIVEDGFSEDQTVTAQHDNMVETEIYSEPFEYRYNTGWRSCLELGSIDRSREREQIRARVQATQSSAKPWQKRIVAFRRMR